jgi:hypothetical protein
MDRDRSVEGFVRGLRILSKYMKSGSATRYFLGAGHDIVYVYTENENIPDEDSTEGLELQSLGFHFSSDNEGWAYFT